MNSIRDRIPINISANFHEDFVNLKKSSDSKISDSPFTDFREIYLLAAVIGIKNKAFKHLSEKKEKIFDSNVFKEYQDLPLIYAIVYSHEKQVLKLADDKYVISVLEGYANGGFPILRQMIFEDINSNLLNLALSLKDELKV